MNMHVRVNKGKVFCCQMQIAGNKNPDMVFSSKVLPSKFLAKFLSEECCVRMQGSLQPKIGKI